MFQEWYDSYNPGGSYYQIEVAVDDRDENWAWYEASGYTWTDLFESPDATAAYNSWAGFGGGIPMTFLLDRDGTIRQAQYGKISDADDAKWRGYITELIGENFE